MTPTETTAEFGRRHGVSPVTVRSWGRQGMPHAEGVRGWEIDPALAAPWLKERGLPRTCQTSLVKADRRLSQTPVAGHVRALHDFGFCVTLTPADGFEAIKAASGHVEIPKNTNANKGE